MHKLLLLFIVLICTFLQGAYSQNISKLDSLHNRLQSMPEDTLKVNALVELNRQSLRQSEFNRMDLYLKELHTLSKLLNYRAGIAHYHSYSGLVSLHRGNYPDALIQFNAALTIWEKLNRRKSMADILTNIGLVYDQQGNYQQAIHYYSKGLSFRDESDTRGKSAAYTNLGIVYFKTGDYPAALSNYLESLHIDELAGDKQDIAYSNNNLGIFYEHQGNLKEALYYYKIANTLCKEIGDQECIGGTNLNIGNLHHALGDNAEALNYYKGSLAIFEEKGLLSEIAGTQAALGTIYFALGDYESALTFQNSALATATQINHLPGMGAALSNLGDIHMLLGQYDQAETYFQKALTIHHTSSEIMQLRNTYQKLSHLDSLRSDYPSALAHYKQYITYKDSMTNEASLNTIAEIQTRFETEKKDKEIQKLENEKKINQLQISLHEKTLRQQQAEENRLRVENLLHLQKAELTDKEKQLHLLEIENSKTKYEAQQTELGAQAAELSLLNHEAAIQQMELKKQRTYKNLLIAGIALSGLLALFVYHYYVTRQKLKLQTLRNKIASDLHDDVGSTLSSISIFSELAQQQSKEVIPLLNTIKESSHKMLDAMGDIVWTINPENDQFEKILIRMRNFAFALLGAKKIDFEFIADKDVTNIQLPMDVRKNLYLIFKEAANNLVKYSDADKAYFSIKEEMGFLTMHIRDNGKGFNIENDPAGNGIKSMKRRAEEIGAKFKIESTPGEGTWIRLQIAV